MKEPWRLLVLPTTILALIADLPTPAQAQAQEWPYNFPRTMRYWPEHEAHIKRQIDLQRKMELKAPVGVRRMSDDPGEKFFLHDWRFEEGIIVLEAVTPELSLRPSRAQQGVQRYGNYTMPMAYPPFLPHTDHERKPRSYVDFWERSLFERDFQCPVGTTSCTSIGQPNSCCNNGENCITVTDTGNGVVGCCPSGGSCGTTISDCDTGSGYTSCPESSNGGCCIPGYACLDVGCVLTATQIVYTTLPVQTVTAGAVKPTSSASSAPDVSVPVATVYSSTTTITPSPTLIVQGTLSCTSGFFQCAASLGGGCCPNGQACGTSGLCPSIATAKTATAVAPVRPTTDIASTLVVTSPASSAVAASGCPTGFYMCSAYYLGGCCRVDRNCDTTSCPSSDSTSPISTEGVTVVAPNGAGAASVSGASQANAAAGTQGSCANGWYLCGSNTGGGCCPSGYVCGASCSATVSGVPAAAKELPSSASILAWAWGFGVLALSAGIGMVVL